MPLPRPNYDEPRDTFMERCLGEATMNGEYPENAQRYAICQAQWERHSAPDEQGAADPGGGGGGGGAGGGAGGGGGADFGRGASAPDSGRGGTVGRSALRVGGAPKNAFRLLPFGRIITDRPALGGDFDFTPLLAAQAVGWFEKIGRRLAIDYEHQSLPPLNTRQDQLAPAAGWIGRLEIRGDGLWAADVEWTPRAAALLSAGEYAYFSPVIYWRGTYGGEIEGLGPVALTNDPATTSIEALVAGTRVPGRALWETPEPPGEHGGKVMAKTIAECLGLSPGATEEQVQTAIAALKTRGSEADQQAVLKFGASLGVVAKTPDELIAGLKAKLTPAAVAGGGRERAGLQRVEFAAGDPGAGRGETVASPELVAAMAQTAARVGELERARLDAEFKEVVSTGAGRGKVTPAMMESMRAIFHSDRTRFDELLATLPVLAGDASLFRQAQTPAGQAGDGTVTALKREWQLNRVNDRGVCLQDEFGGVEEAFVAYRKHDAAGDIRIVGPK